MSGQASGQVSGQSAPSANGQQLTTEQLTLGGADLVESPRRAREVAVDGSTHKNTDALLTGQHTTRKQHKTRKQHSQATSLQPSQSRRARRAAAATSGVQRGRQESDSLGRSKPRQLPGFFYVAPSEWPHYFVEWLTSKQHALRSLALLRIFYGVAILWVLFSNFADRRYLWGVGSGWADQLSSLAGYPLFLRLFYKDNAAIFDGFYYALILFAALFVVGIGTRIVTPVLLALWVSLESNNVLLNNGGDVALRITLLFFVFANLSGHYSIDALIQKLLAKRGTQSRLFKAGRVKNALHNTALILAIYQFLLIYVSSGLLKLSGQEWLQGSALYYALSLDAFMPFEQLSETLRLVTPFVLVATFLSVWLQVFLPVLVIFKKTRLVTLVLLAVMQLLIGLLLGLWPFALVMIGLSLLLVDDKIWHVKKIFAKDQAPKRARHGG